MLTNKWVQFALSLVIALLGYLATVDWTTLLPSKAGVIVSVIGVAKMILNALAPSANATVIPTGGSVITHTTTP